LGLYLPFVGAHHAPPSGFSWFHRLKPVQFAAQCSVALDDASDALAQKLHRTKEIFNPTIQTTGDFDG